MLKHTTARLKASRFAANFAVLAGGTLLAQLITLLASPLLTRIYSPEDFGLFAVFMAIVGSLLPGARGKYEVALVLPKINRHGRYLLAVALQFAIAFTAVLALFLLFFGDRLLAVLDAEDLGGWVYLTPLAILIASVGITYTYYANRSQRYQLISRSKIYQAAATVVINLSLGVTGAGFEGLIAGAFAGFIAGALVLLFHCKEEVPTEILLPSPTSKSLFLRYKDFPLYNASSAMLDGLASSMPVFFLAGFYPAAIVGYFSLITRVVNTPLAFISSSISQINLKQLVDLVNAGVDARPYLFKLTALLSVVAIPCALVFSFASVQIFTLIFGEAWADAGHYMQILAPAMFLRFVVSTLSSSLGATHNNRIGMFWKILSLVTNVIVFSIFAPQGDADRLFYAILTMDLALYALYYALIVYAVGHPRNH